MHDEIIRYSLTGELPDSNVVQAKERMTLFIEGMMKDNGCVRVFDLESQFTLDYDPGKETFRFELTLYGVFVGREAWRTSGMTNGTTTTSSTLSPKSMESSNTVE